MLHRRRTHQKSQHGCSRCKARHVKCDEGTPCGNCKRRNEDCDLVNTINGVSRCGKCGAKDSLTEWAQEIYLMHHFTTQTAYSMNAHDEDVSRAWHTIVPPIALEHPFLMSGLLAMSAMHLAYQRPSEEARWTRLAIEHQSKALTAAHSMIPHTTDFSEQKVLALFATIIITSWCTVVNTRFESLHQADGGQIPISDYTSTIFHIRGFGKVADLKGILLQAGPLEALCRTHSRDPMRSDMGVPTPDQSPRQSPEQHPVPRQAATCSQYAEHLKMVCPTVRSASTRAQLERLERVFGYELQSAAASALIDAIGLLRMIYAEMEYAVTQRSVDIYPSLPWKWPVLLQQPFFTLLQGSHPGALVVFAHFALLSSPFDQWWIQGWANRAIAAVNALVKEPWKSLLDWPIDQLNNGFPALHEIDGYDGSHMQDFPASAEYQL